jgi:Phage integrase family
LKWAINSPDFRSAVAGLQSGSTRKRISRGNLATLFLPIAPLAEQTRIADEIEKQFTRLDAAVAALKRVQANLKRYRAAVLKAACEGCLVPTEAELLDEVVALRAWFKERREDGSQVLFLSAKGGIMTRMQFLRLFKKAAQAAGVAPRLAHPHALRHALCSMMAAQHADVYAIQQRAGHKNISNTMIYTHVSDKQAGEACQAALMSAFS